MKTLTFREWAETYQPIQNPFDPAADHDGMMFETFGRERSHVDKTEPCYVWTMVSTDDDNLVIIPGPHLVNRMGYFITKTPFVSEDIEVTL